MQTEIAVSEAYATLTFKERMLLLASRTSPLGEAAHQTLSRAKKFEAYVDDAR